MRRPAWTLHARGVLGARLVAVSLALCPLKSAVAERARVLSAGSRAAVADARVDVASPDAAQTSLVLVVLPPESVETSLVEVQHPVSVCLWCALTALGGVEIALLAMACWVTGLANALESGDAVPVAAASARHRQIEAPAVWAASKGPGNRLQNPAPHHQLQQFWTCLRAHGWSLTGDFSPNQHIPATRRCPAAWSP